MSGTASSPTRCGTPLKRGDWPLAASIVIDHLAIGQIIEPRGSPSLAGEFGAMPDSLAWTEPQPYLVCAAVALVRWPA